MNRIATTALITLSTSILSLGGCVTREVIVERPAREVVTTCPPPPAPVIEVITPCPGPEFVWVVGVHEWVGGRWVWVGGHWARPAHAGSVWVAGHWRPVHGGYAWDRGHWR